MKTTCPTCGTSLSLDVLVAHESARAALAAAFEMPAPIGKLLIRYCALFRPDKRALTMDRMAGLLEELLPAIQTGQIDRNGRVWPVPPAIWPAALQELLDRAEAGKITRPLKSHGYLFEILVGKADKAEARAEARVEETRRAAPSGKRTGPQQAAGFINQLRAAAKKPPGETEQ